MIFNLTDCKTIIRATVYAALNGLFEFFILSGYNNATGEENTPILHERLQKAGFSVIAGFGSWQGVQEQSLLVLAPYGAKNFKAAQYFEILNHALGFGQQTIIHATAENKAVLLTTGGKAVAYLSGISIGESALSAEGFSSFADIAFTYTDYVDAQTHIAAENESNHAQEAHELAQTLKAF